MNSSDPENKFIQIKRICRWMVALPILALGIALSVFILEGFPYPGRSSFSHSWLSTPLAAGVSFFDILYLGVLLLFVITLIPVAVLIWNREVRKIYLALRFQTLYRFVFYAWVVFFASRLMLSSYYRVLFMPEVLLRNFIFGGVLMVAFFYIKKKYAEKPELMFP